MPPLTIESASALVGGISPHEASAMRAQQPDPPPANIKSRLLRSFPDQLRQVLVVGTTAELPRLFALEMKAANKVEFLVEAPVVVDEPKPAIVVESESETPPEKPAK